MNAFNIIIGSSLALASLDSDANAIAAVRAQPLAELERPPAVGAAA